MGFCRCARVFDLNSYTAISFSAMAQETATTPASMDEVFYNLEHVDMDGFACLQSFHDHDEAKTAIDIDPRLLSTANSPMSTESHNETYGMDSNMSNHMLNTTAPDGDFALFPEPALAPRPPPYFDTDMMKFEPLRHQMLGHRRSVSVPPEDMEPSSSQPPVVFHRGGHYLGDSTAGAKTRRWNKKGGLKKGAQSRHSPYPSVPSTTVSLRQRFGLRRTQTQPGFVGGGPTSAPSVAVTMPYLFEENQEFGSPFAEPPPPPPSRFSPGLGLSPHVTESSSVVALPRGPELHELEALDFGPRTNTNTAVLGMLGYASMLQRDCEAMRDFLSRGFRDGADDELESLRQEKRAFNHTVTSLDEPLDTLPLPTEISTTHTDIPTTGKEIRDLDIERIHLLLELYNIPFVTHMFLHEKKLAYLRFLGACRALMHAVLD